MSVTPQENGKYNIRGVGKYGGNGWNDKYLNKTVSNQKDRSDVKTTNQTVAIVNV